MKNPRHPLLPVAVFAVCAIAGWLAARGTAAADAAGSDAAGGTKAAKTERAPTRSGMPAEVLAMLAPVRNAKNTEERMRATLQLAANIPQADIAKWLSAGWFDGGEDMQANLFTRTLLSRWQEEDPAAMLSFCIRKEMRITYEFAGEWARRDPAAALACIQQETDPGKRNSMLAYMSAALAKSDPALVASHLGELFASAGQDGMYQAGSMIRELAMSSPDLLGAESANWPKALQDLARKSLATAALKKNFTGGLAALSLQQDGKRTFIEAMGNDSDLAKLVASDLRALPAGWLGDLVSYGNAGYYLTQADPAKWLGQNTDYAALGLSDNTAQNLRSYALSQLASSNPEKLKSMLAGQELSAGERSSAIASLVSSMSRPDAEAWIAGMSDEDRKIAEANFSPRSGPDGKPLTPASLLGDLATGKREMSWAEARAMGNWGGAETQAFTAGFDALPADQKAQLAGKLVANQYSQQPPELSAKALSYLLANPGAVPKAQEGENEEVPDGIQNQRMDPLTAAACNIAGSWGMKDPAAAANWIKGLPAGEARTWAARNLIDQWREYDPAAANRWAATMPGGELRQAEKAKQGR